MCLSGGGDNYKTERLESLCEISSGGTPSRNNAAYWNNGTIPWIKTQELNNKILLDTDEKITELGLNESSARVYPIDSIIVAMYGATIGQTAKLGIEAATNQACAVLFNFNKDINADFLWKTLIANQEKLKSLGHGRGQPNLNANDVKQFKIPVPSLADQKRIIAEIEKYEAAIAQAQAEMDGAAEKKKEILNKWLK